MLFRYAYINTCIYRIFVKDPNLDLTQCLSIFNFWRYIYFCLYFVSVDIQFLSIFSFCRYSVSVDIQFLSIFSFCRYSVSVDIQFPSGIESKPWLSGNILPNIKNIGKWMVKFFRKYALRLLAFLKFINLLWFCTVFVGSAVILCA